jgi:hypothetical protein
MKNKPMNPRDVIDALLALVVAVIIVVVTS